MHGIDLDREVPVRIVCPRHAGPLLCAELEALDYEPEAEGESAAIVRATLADCLELVLKLRTAEHVRYPLTRFRCPSPKALYTHTAAYAWEHLIPNDGYLSVTSVVDHPSINNTMHANLVVKDAVVDRILGKTSRRPDSGSDRTGVVIHLHWKDDRASLSISVNGRRLADRGYRRIPHMAPMRETLAASVLLAMGYDGSSTLVNPMCGSGTLAIEAALIAADRAPGLLRSDYGILHTSLEIDELWRQTRARAKPRPRTKPETHAIIATDHDPHAIEAARKNAAVAGVEHLIDFAVCDFADTRVPDGPGHVVLNPEYGIRMGDVDELEPIYERIGDFFKQQCAGKTGHVFTGSKHLAGKIGLRTSKRTPFVNASIPCRLLSYELYAGSAARDRS